MIALALFPTFRFRLSLGRPAAAKPAPPTAEDKQRSERAFLNDVMDHCPEAFRSEEDIQTMMYLYPRYV